MHIGRHFTLRNTLIWSARNFLIPFVYALVIVTIYEIGDIKALAIPALPMSLVGIGVAFYLGFKNNASYDRLWEARKIWGAIVNASRSWAYGSRDLIISQPEDTVDEAQLHTIHTELVHRHIAWMDALRHQLRHIKTWEHDQQKYNEMRRAQRVAEYEEDLLEVISPNLPNGEAERALDQINPAAFLIGQQSRRLATLRRDQFIDGFAHLHLQEMLQELMTQQGKAERIKNFPLPRQYVTVNKYFAALFSLILPLGLIPEFAKLHPDAVWLSAVFAGIVSWVFLTADQIGEWSENPFEGLVNDVPITAMARGIERDMRQMIGETDLPEPRKPNGQILY